VIVLCATAFLGLALVNFATGSIPLLASNIDATRFAGGGGAFAQLWIWIIGGIEWLLVVAGVQRVVFGRLNRSSWCIVIVGLGILTLLASRSFFLIVGLALLVAYASVKRVTISRLAIVGVAGLLVLGATGSARVHHSDPTGARQQFLQSQRIDSVYGTISQSAATGPVVLATVLDNVPALFQYQHGRFALRDFRALLPLHPLGRPEQSGIWVTDAILHRDPTQIGGSPPTLVGGLYIDFGVTGIALGSLLLGFCLVAMHRWARSSRTIGSLTAYSYASAYIALSAYSYVSVKPTVVLVGVLSLMAHRMELRSAHRARRRVADEHPGVAIAPGASRA
jgi:oligosaccharide repeat unit polymerase